MRLRGTLCKSKVSIRSKNKHVFGVSGSEGEINQTREHKTRARTNNSTYTTSNHCQFTIFHVT